MPATTTATAPATKAKALTALLAGLKKVPEPAEPRPVLEHLLYAVLRENSSRAQADDAFRALVDRFFDWNEIRVSSPHEVAAALGALPQPLAKAQRVVSLLQEVFEANYSFDLDGLPKKGVKPAARQVARYQASSDFVVAWVTLYCLDGHAIPVDLPSLAALKKLGIVEESEDNPAAVMAQLENQIPKAKALAFVELLAEHAANDDASRPKRKAKAEAPRPKPR
jgi:endonuclease III